MISARQFFFAAALLGLSAVAAPAQVATGTPAFGTFNNDHVADVINLANLNAHVNIPVLHKAGRGTNFTYDASYDASVWYPVTSGSTKSWQPVTNWGWRAITEPVTGYINYTEIDTGPDMYGCYYRYYENWVYHDSFGVPHAFAGAVGEYDYGPVTYCGTRYYYGFTAAAPDGSGYTLTSPDGSYFSGVTLYGRNGTIINAPINTGSGAASAVDRNGNVITVNGSGQFFDTLNGTTPVLTASGSGTPTSPMVFTYTAPSGASASYAMKYSTYTVQTNFGCGGVADFPATSEYLVSEIDLPDVAVNPSDKYTFTYEPTYQHSGHVTGRLASVTLPTGGTITYTYGTSGTNGIVCADGSASYLTRKTPDTGTSNWVYAHSESGTAWTTTITDPTAQQNQTVMNFQGIYLTEEQIYNGSVSPSNLVQTITKCYNGNTSNCNTTAIATPITQISQSSQWSSGSPSKVVTSYDGFGDLLEKDEYDYGASTATRKTVVSYASLGNYISDRRATVTVEDGSNNIKSQTTYCFDEGTPSGTTSCAASGNPIATSGIPQHVSVSGSRGNITTVAQLVSGSTILGEKITYYDTGEAYQATDVNGAQYTNSYAGTSCASAFPTTITEPIGSPALTVNLAWNCTGGVLTSVTDANGKSVSLGYTTDPYFWRPNSLTDQLGNITNISYTGQTSAEGKLLFNGNSSTQDVLFTVDGLGRGHISQTKESPTSSTYDSVETDYDVYGNVIRTTLPYAGTAGQSNASAPYLGKLFDQLGRKTKSTDSGGRATSSTYTANDVYRSLGPAPTGENAKRSNYEYDGLSRMTSVCEVTSLTGSGTCGQSSPYTGYWTKYAYDVNNNLTGVTQNAQSSGTQTRTYVYDGLGRKTSETNPEVGQNGNGTISYTYDTDSTCGTSKGDLVKKVDPAGDTICNAYDALHRLTSTTYSGGYSSSTPNRYFVYDAATVNGNTMQNAKGHLAEAYTMGAMPFQDTDFEASSSLPPPGWSASYATLSYDTTTQYAGARSLKTAATALYGGAYSTYQAGVPGKSYTISGYVKSDGTCSAYIQVRFLDINGSYLDSAQTGGSTSTSWQFVTATKIAPANTVYTQLGLPNGNSTGAGVCEFDNISASSNAVGTDIGFSYTARGEVSDVYEKTPNSGGYYHVTQTYWANGAPDVLSGLSGLPTITYNPDGEGRISTISASSGQNPITSSSYNPASLATAVGFGSSDNDGFTYDPNTNRMTQYSFNVNSQSLVGNLTWNQIGTLAKLQITDPFDSSDTQTCTYTHDDLSRLAGVNCGSIWAQTFSYDAFGNINKIGNSSFNPSYSIGANSTNHMTQIGSSTPTYDLNGEVTNDFLHSYEYDANGRPVTIDTVGATYDALGRMVEQNRSGSYTQIVYAPSGAKLALMNGTSTLVKGYVPLTGGSMAVYNSSGLAYYRHSDWVGSSRLASTPSRAVYFDGAYAPFGEVYANIGTTDFSFTGMNQDTVSNLYDFPGREYGIQGRWPSWDPAGLSAVFTKDPQTLNRYAYVRNSPLHLIDPEGYCPGQAGQSPAPKKSTKTWIQQNLLGCGSAPTDPIASYGIKGAINGAWVGAGAGFLGGELAGGLAGIPGAFLGGFTGATVGATSGIFTGTAVAGICYVTGAYN